MLSTRLDSFHRYKLNLMNRYGRVIELRLGAEASVRAAPHLFPTVDQRDGFEVAWASCESPASQARPSSMR